MYFLVFLCFALLATVLLVAHYDRKAITKLRQKLSDQESYYQHLGVENERLKTYMDNQHLVWHPGESEVLVFNGEPDRRLVVLIGAMELYDIFHGRWNDGLQAAVKTQEEVAQLSGRHELAVTQEADNIKHIHYSFAHRKFDADFERLVLMLTAVAHRYGHTQQLRDRFSNLIIGFRSYLTNKQDGVESPFPDID